MDPKLYAILSGWYATESPFTFINTPNDDDENDGNLFLLSL